MSERWVWVRLFVHYLIQSSRHPHVLAITINPILQIGLGSWSTACKVTKLGSGSDHCNKVCLTRGTSGSLHFPSVAHALSLHTVLHPTSLVLHWNGDELHEFYMFVSCDFITLSNWVFLNNTILKRIDCQLCCVFPRARKK